MRRKSKNGKDRSKPRAAFRVRDYPFFYMHWIVTKNNQNIGEAVREFDITPQIWRILALLQERDGISITELSEASLIDRTLLSRILTDLERRALVRKKPNSEDKRFTGIYLTPAGAKMFAAVLPSAQRQIERAIADLNATELADLKKSLISIMRNLSRSPYL